MTCATLVTPAEVQAQCGSTPTITENPGEGQTTQLGEQLIINKCWLGVDFGDGTSIALDVSRMTGKNPADIVATNLEYRRTQGARELPGFVGYMQVREPPEGTSIARVIEVLVARGSRIVKLSTFERDGRWACNETGMAALMTLIAPRVDALH